MKTKAEAKHFPKLARVVLSFQSACIYLSQRERARGGEAPCPYGRQTLLIGPDLDFDTSSSYSLKCACTLGGTCEGLHRVTQEVEREKSRSGDTKTTKREKLERERERERERGEFWWNLLFWVGELLLSHSNLFLRRKIKYCINAQNRNPHIESSYILLPPPPFSSSFSFSMCCKSTYNAIPRLNFAHSRRRC